MLAAVRLLQPRLGLGPALAAGWLVHIPILLWRIREPRPAAQSKPAAAVENEGAAGIPGPRLNVR